MKLSLKSPHCGVQWWCTLLSKGMTLFRALGSTPFLARGKASQVVHMAAGDSSSSSLCLSMSLYPVKIKEKPLCLWLGNLEIELSHPRVYNYGPEIWMTVWLCNLGILSHVGGSVWQGIMDLSVSVDVEPLSLLHVACRQESDWGILSKKS